MMKYVLLPILYCLFLLSAQAQDLVKGLHESPYTYIFLLSNDEARQLYENKFESLLPAYTDVLVDSFPTGKSYTGQLAAGNYLFVHADEENLVLELERVHNVALKLLPDPLKFIAAVYDSSGKLLPDAKVLVDGKTMSHASETNSYQRAFRKKYKLLEVSHQGVSNFFFLEKYQGGYRQSLPRTLVNKIIFYRPVRTLWRPVVDIVDAIRWGEHPEWFSIFDPDHQRDFGGYLTLNQPIYRPGDTVRYKGFVLKKHRPFSRPLTVKLFGKTSKGFKTYTLTTLEAYRKGAYEGSFVLHDSLHLLLDTYATLIFEHKRKELRSQIKLEDYELGGNNFSLRASRNMHVQGAPPTIMMQGVDVNGLSLLGAEVKLIALTSKVDYLPAALQLVVPDTLWQHTIKLEPDGETQFQLPDSLFLEADIDYNLVGILKTARQEFLTQRLQMQYRREALVNYVLDGDSLYIGYLQKGLSDTLQATLNIQLYNQQEVIKQEISLPEKFRIDPRWDALTVWVGHNYETLNLKQKPSLVEHAIERNADSLLISISSGRHIPFWYSVYTGKKKKKRLAGGFSAGEPVLWQARASKRKTYFLKLDYLWGGEMIAVKEDIPYLKKVLNLSMQAPQQVRPGEEVDLEVQVTNREGKPMEGVDITAFAYNKQMPASLNPEVPYLGKERWMPMYTRPARQQEASLDKTEALAWDAWRQRLGLDSIAYYQFAYPQQALYRYELPLADSSTQFAPYVVKDGVPQQVHIIYLNGTPVYYSEVETQRAYAFVVSPYRSFTLSLRTATHLITLDSVRFRKGHKNILSLGADIRQANIKVKEMPSQLSQQELDKLNRHLIIVNHSYNKHFAYLEQGDQLQVINSPNTSQRARGVLAGPFTQSSISYEVIENFKTSFLLETGYDYRIQPNLVFARNTTPEWEGQLAQQRMALNPEEVAINRPGVLQWWRDYLAQQNRPAIKYEYPQKTSLGNGRVMLVKPWENISPDQPGTRLQLALVIGQTDTAFVQVYPVNKALRSLRQELHELPPGNYQLICLLDDGSFLRTDSVSVKENSTTYLNLEVLSAKSNDQFIELIRRIIDKHASQSIYSEQQVARELDYIKQTSRLQRSASGILLVWGTVSDHSEGLGLPGVAVRIKGTNIGTVTDLDGNYQLNLNPGDELVFSFVGYVDVVHSVTGNNPLDVTMKEDIEQLSEVVVTAYGSVERTRKALSYSVTTLQGRAAGVQITSSNIRIRGSASVSGSNKPLIIVDGVPYEGDISDLDPALVQTMEVIKGEQAVAIYGSRAAHGVMLITSGKKKADKDGPEMPLQGVGSQQNSLRTNFRDWAFWQPRLSTDAQGKATFTVNFPDNITAWDTQLLAMGKKRYTGQSRQTIKAVKPIWASIGMPRFLLTGDSALVMGQVSNYSPDTLSVTTRFTLDAVPIQLREAALTTSLVDSVWVSRATTDSLSVTYEVSAQAGLLDGERRQLPVYPKGVREAKGEFLILRPDSSQTITLPASSQPWQFQGYASSRGPLLDEIQHLIDYAYYCNEQAASKLYALLMYNGFREEADKMPRKVQLTKKLIRQLEEGQGKDGLWGWWPGNRGEFWITRHVVGALQLARQQGYALNYDSLKLLESLQWKLKATHYPNEQLEILEVLAQLGAESIPYADYIPVLEDSLAEDENARLRLLRLRDAAKLPYTAAQVLALKHETILGAYYWGFEKGWNPEQSSLAATAWAYDLLRKSGATDAMGKAELYLWGNRPGGYWRNTYESAQVLLHLMPRALLHEAQKPALSLQMGNTSTEITAFPLHEPLTLSGTELSVSNTGNTPVYLSAYTKDWVAEPAAAGEDFQLSSRFSQNRQYLKAGEAVELITEVKVKKAAEYVMIEIPIPAGCTYEEKGSHWSEIHREYYRDRVVIFSRHLPEGEHTYTLKLLPRFKGTYTLNPAQVSLMYFPHIFGRSGIRSVEIR